MGAILGILKDLKNLIWACVCFFGAMAIIWVLVNIAWAIQAWIIASFGG